MEETTIPKRKSMDDDPSLQRDLRAKMKRVFTDFAAIEALNVEETKAREKLEKEMRLAPYSWEYICGIAEGINILTGMYPSSATDITFRLIARLAIVVTAKLGLEAIQEAEDLESFPEELDNE